MASKRPGRNEIDASIEELARAHRQSRKPTLVESDRTQVVSTITDTTAKDTTGTGTITAMAAQVHAVAQATGEDYERLRAEMEQAVAEGRLVVEVATDVINESAWRDRDAKGFADEAFRALCQSIADHGQMTPVALRRLSGSSDAQAKDKTDSYEIIFGHRRVQACRALGRPVRAVVVEADDRELLRRMLIENAQRRDLSAIEKGRHYRRLLASEQFSRAELAKLVGVSPQQISNLAGIAELPVDVLTALGDERELSINVAQQLRSALDVSGGQSLAPMLEAMSMVTGDANTKARILAKRLKRRESDTASQLIRDGAGHRFARISRSGTQTVIRFDPGLDEDTLRQLAERLPELYASLGVEITQKPKNETE